MASIVSAGTTSATALNMSADTTGILQLASNNGTVGLTIDTSQNVGINNSSPTIRTKLMVSSSNASDTLTVGTVSGGFSITNTNSSYGLQFGSLSTGNSWIQSARMDGTATAYNLLLQTGGGNVGIGTLTPTANSGTSLVVYDASSPRIRLTSATTGQAAGDGAELSLSGSNFYIENREAQDIIFYSGSERGRFDSSGNFLLGTTSTSGSVSNFANILGGVFKSFSGSVSAATNTYTTLFTAPTTNGSYIVTVFLSANDVNNYQSVVLVSTQGGTSTKVTTLVSSGLLAFQMSGYSLQATQNSGGSNTINYSAIRISG